MGGVERSKEVCTCTCNAYCHQGSPCVRRHTLSKSTNAITLVLQAPSGPEPSPVISVADLHVSYSENCRHSNSDCSLSAYALPVKSVSVSNNPALGFFSHVQALADLIPQAQVFPLGLEFSSPARSQVHSPAARRRHEHRGPLTVFSVAALEQLHAS